MNSIHSYQLGATSSLSSLLSVQEARAGAAVGDCADLRQDGPGPRHRAGDAAHDDHEKEDAEEEDEKQDKIVILS